MGGVFGEVVQDVFGAGDFFLLLGDPGFDGGGEGLDFGEELLFQVVVLGFEMGVGFDQGVYGFRVGF